MLSRQRQALSLSTRLALACWTFCSLSESQLELVDRQMWWAAGYESRDLLVIEPLARVSISSTRSHCNKCLDVQSLRSSSPQGFFNCVQLRLHEVMCDPRLLTCLLQRRHVSGGEQLCLRCLRSQKISHANAAQVTAQFCLWDHWRQLREADTAAAAAGGSAAERLRRTLHLAQLGASLISSLALPPTALKVLSLPPIPYCAPFTSPLS